VRTGSAGLAQASTRIMSDFWTIVVTIAVFALMALIVRAARRL
jgi:hypothetical protein